MSVWRNIGPAALIGITTAAIACSPVAPSAETPTASAAMVKRRAVPRRPPSTTDDAAGRHIYHTGQSLSGQPVTARPGDATYESPAVLWRCATCHAADARGNPPGVPSNWMSLESLFRTATINQRTRPAYNDATLARAITEGIDSGGNRLSGAMPRYRMSPADLASLVAYVTKLVKGETSNSTEEVSSVTRSQRSQ